MLEIIEGRTSTFAYRDYLRSAGCRYFPSRKCWVCSDTEACDDLIAFCRKHDLTYKRKGDQWSRSSSYRKRFFKSNNGLDGNGKYYRCVFCGKILPAHKTEVDHLVSVAAAGRTKQARKRLKEASCESVNDAKNLVPACTKCNRKKGSKQGIWYWRGRLGQSEKLWAARFRARWIALALLCLMVGIVIGRIG